MRLQRRSAFGWGPTPAPSAPCRNGVAVHYNGGNTALAGKSHSACVSYWKRTRSFHINDRGWLDIGYLFMVCVHGYVMEGRGFGRAQAAQPGGNTTWTSVTFASGPSERPTTAQLNAFRELRAWLRARGVAAAIRPHSAFVSTACPGNILRGLIRNGTLTGAPSKPGGGTPEPSEEEVLRTVVDLGARDPQTIPGGARQSLSFEVEYLDQDKVHTDAKDGTRYPSIFPKGGDQPYAVTVQLVLDAKPADGVMISLASYDRDSNDWVRDIRFEDVVTQRHIMHANLRMNSGQKYRADIVNNSGQPVTVNDAYLLIAH
jgi:hypothetical protein